MDFVKEVVGAMVGISKEEAKRLEKEILEAIEAREQRGECACGTPCGNYRAHDAADHIILLQLRLSLHSASSET